MITQLQFRDIDAELESERAETERLSRARYTEEEVRELVCAAHEKGRKAGHAQGLEDGRAEMEQTLLAQQTGTLSTLGAQVGEMSAQAQSHRDALEAQVLDFALSVCERVFPDFLERTSLDRAEQHVRRAIRYAMGSAAIRVSLSPAAALQLGPRVSDVARDAGCAVTLDIQPDTSMHDGDARVEWDNGVLDYSFETVCDSILSQLRGKQADLRLVGQSGSTHNV